MSTSALERRARDRALVTLHRRYMRETFRYSTDLNVKEKGKTVPSFPETPLRPRVSLEPVGPASLRNNIQDSSIGPGPYN